jgi:hypothetical protein
MPRKPAPPRPKRAKAAAPRPAAPKAARKQPAPPPDKRNKRNTPAPSAPPVQTRTPPVQTRKARAKPAPPPPPPSPPKPKRPRPGKPAYEPTDINREMVRVMVAGGIEQALIAGALRISITTLTKHFRPQIDNGAAEVNTVCIAMHIKKIKAGDMRAIEWWQRSRMGWTEKIQVEKVGDTPLRVIVELMGDPAPDRGGPARTRLGFDANDLVEFVG